jgi:tetratricopeptide (TPR) repeat protein
MCSAGNGTDSPCLSTVDNSITGTARGAIVQAGSIGSVHFEAAHEEHVVPSQLPPAPRLFASRRQELADLRRWWAEEDDQSLVVVISGLGGVGKTSLALRWLHDVRDQFPNGQLYIDLCGSSEAEPVTSEEALEWFLLALGVTADRMPSELPRRQALYRSVTAGLSLVVLLDNAMSAAQVRPLLPSSPGTVAVVTSRLRLTGLAMDGARFVEVDPMDVTGSMELLGRAVDDPRVAEEPEAARELAHLCGGLPIALSMVGARLSTHPRRTLSSEAATLRSEQRRLSALVVGEDSSVEAVFDLSYRGLPTAAARVYRLCSLHQGIEFGRALAAAAVGEAVDDVEDLLDTLVDSNLLIEVGDRRFRFHDLLRLHAQQLADWEESPADRSEAVRRMVEYYLDTLVSADLVLHPHRRRLGPRYERDLSGGPFADDRDALRWLETERANLNWSLSSAQAHGWDDLVWEFCEALWGFFLHSRHYDHWIRVHASGIAAAHRCGSPLVEARLRSQLGFAYAKLHRYDDAITENRQALSLAEAVGDDRTIATALSQLGRAAKGKRDLPAALDYYARARDLQDAVGERRGVALCRRRIGQVLVELGRYGEATDELRAAAATMSELSDRTQYARTLMFLGTTAIQAGQPEQAAGPLTEALELMRELGSPYYQAQILAALGEFAERTDDLGAARDWYTQALQHYSEIDDPGAVEVRAKLSSLAGEE